MEKKKLSVKEWCDQQVAEGKEIVIKWEGGGDSGWVYFEIDGEQVENEYTDALVNYCYDALDYGSWAGEFDASGEAVYNPESGTFSGTDYYRESDTVPMNINAVLTIPKDLWFESVDIELDEYDEPTSVEPQISLVVNNGFKTDDHKEVENKIAEEFKSIVDENIDPDAYGDEIRGVWFNERFNIRDLEKDANGNYIVNITHIDIGIYNTDDKFIEFEVENIEIQEK